MLEDGKHDNHHNSFQNVKIPGQMDLIPGQMVKFLDNLGKPWMVGRYAIACKNLNKMREKK